jgi:hypothetical protein
MLSQKNAAALRSARRRIFKRNFGIVFLVVLIFYYNGLRTRHYLTRQGVVPPGLSPWTHLLLNADNGSFLEIGQLSCYLFNASKLWVKLLGGENEVVHHLWTLLGSSASSYFFTIAI